MSDLWVPSRLADLADWQTATAGKAPVADGNGGMSLTDVATQTDLFDTTDALGPLQEVPCTVPTYDGNPSTGHTSIVYVPDGWNGYRFWMAHTPFPAAPREWPSVVASHDGIHFEVPAGGPDPVVDLAAVQAHGYAECSDPHLVMLADGATIAMYFRPFGGGGGEAVWRVTSTDGKTWTPMEQVTATVPSPSNGFYASPSVLVEADGTYSMWCVDVTAAPASTAINKWTSADGVNWTGPAACAFPAPPAAAGAQYGATPWHIHVQRLADRYFALVYDQGAGNVLYFLVSSDGGLTWKADPDLPAVPPVPWTRYSSGFYRSSFVILPGSPLRFRIWATAFYSATGNPYDDSADWRVVMLDVTPGGLRLMYISANEFQASLGAPTRTDKVLSRWSAWNVATGQGISVARRFPDRWQRIRATMDWTNPNAGAGTVNVQLTRLGISAGSNLSPGGDQSSPSPVPAAPAQNVLASTVMGEMLPVTAGKLYELRLNRTAGANDTLAGSMQILGMLIERLG